MVLDINTEIEYSTSVSDIRQSGMQRITQYDPFLFIGNVEDRGRGVFTSCHIPKGSLVHFAPVVALSPKDNLMAEKTFLYEYLYGWKQEDSGAVALGLGSLFNHDGKEANLFYECVHDLNVISYIAVRDIKKGEELTINYQQRFPEIPLWFEKQ